MLEAFGSRTSYEDSYGSSQASSSFPCGPTQQQPPPFDTGFGHPPYQSHGGTQFSTMAPAAGPSSYYPMPTAEGTQGKYLIRSPKLSCSSYFYDYFKQFERFTGS